MKHPSLTRVVRAIAAAIPLVLLVSSHDARPAAQSSPACATSLDLRMLVMSADGTEADLSAIQAALDYLGTPYDTYIATDHPGGLDPAMLATGCSGHYQGVILATDNLVHELADGSFAAALSPGDASALAAYETRFGVRQVTWYTFPTPALGFNWPSGASGDTRPATLTSRGAQIFPYLNAGAAIPIQYSWTYLTTPLDASTTPLLTDADGHTLAAIHTYPDGRETLAMTFDSNPYVLHSMLLSYGIVNWVAKGLFVGDRHVYVSPQVDDLFIDDALWTESTACLTSVDATGFNQRITGVDLTAVSTWQRARRLQPQTGDLRLTMAFNGFGTTSGYRLTLVGGNDRLIDPTTGVPTDPTVDTLTPAAHTLQQDFWWVSHTYTHQNLDEVSGQQVVDELQTNAAMGPSFPFTRFVPHSLVQPDVSGLANQGFLDTAVANGIQFLVSDTSRPGQNNPSPNVGFPNQLQPGIFVIPRRANNLFFNVATPSEWAAEYNCHYNSYWGRNLSFQEILDVESDQLLAHLLRGELDPWMFHQTNLAAYDDAHTRTLLTDLLDATLAKYSAYVNLPVLSPSMDALGARMAGRTAMRQFGITATLQFGTGVVLTSPVAVTVPVTGLELPGAEHYGGQAISWVPLSAGVPTIASYSVVDRPTVSAAPSVAATSGAAVALSGSAFDPNSPPRPLTFAWMQTSGPAVTLTGADSLTPGFTAPVLPPGATPVTLEFAFIADNGVLSASAPVTVVVTEPALPPVADAGADQFVPAGAPVTLHGSAGDPNVPGLPLNASWLQTGGPAVSLVNANSLTPTFIAPPLAIGSTTATLTFRLTVDNTVSSKFDDTNVVVDPPIGAPVVTVEGGGQTVDSGSGPFTLTGSVVDPNSPTLGLMVTHAWTQTAGPPVTLSDPAQTTVTFVAPTLMPFDPAATLEFTLSAGNGVLTGSAKATFLVRPPIATLGAAQTLSADGNGPQTTAPFAVGAGHLLVAFVSSDGPLDSPQSLNVSGGGLTWTNVQRANGQRGSSEVWTAIAPADLSGVTVTADQTQAAGEGAPAFYCSITVMTFPDGRGIGATSNAGGADGAAAVTLSPNSSGSLVLAIGNDANLPAPRLVPDNQVVVHQAVSPGGDSHWLQGLAAGPVAAAGLPIVLNEEPTAAGPWNFAAVEIVHRAAPLASAGIAQSADSGAPVTLHGTSSDTNVPARPLTYAWSQTSGPAVALAGATSLTPTFSAPVISIGSPAASAGFTLTVSNGVLSSLATTTVDVHPPIGAPVVTVGAGPVVDSGSVVTLTGAAVDPNAPSLGLTLTYAWTQPPTDPAVTLNDSSQPSVTFTAPTLLPGDPPLILHFLLTAGNGVAAGSAGTTVTVRPPISAPVVTVGAAQVVQAGSVVTLTGSALDPNSSALGLTLTYTWTQPPTNPAVIFSDPSQPIVTFTAPTLLPGDPPLVLDFLLTAANGFAAGSAGTTVTVRPPINPPVVTVGAAATVESGSVVTLTGGAVDSNSPALGLTLTYAWTQPPGDPAVTFSDPSQPSVTFTAPTLVPGNSPLTLHFLLTAGNGFAAGSAGTTVTVRPPIAAPVVTVGAGPIVESGSLVTLTGSAVDPNSPALGLALTYAWTQPPTDPAVTLTDPSQPSVTFTAPTLLPSDPPVTLHFLLTAGNGSAAGSAGTTVIVRPPIAALGASQTVFADGNGPQTTAPFAVGAGNLIVAFVSSDGPVDSPQSLNVSGGGLTWTNVQRANGQRGSSEVWTTVAPAAVPDLTVTAGQTQVAGEGEPPFYLSMAVLTFPDARGIGATSTAGGSDGAANVVLSPTSSGSLLFAVGNDASLTTPRSVPENQVVVHQAVSANGDSHWLQGLAAGPVATAGVPIELNEEPATAGPWNFAAVEIVHRAAPVADAGPAQSVSSGAPVTLSGSSSDSNVPARPLTYAWSQTSGPAVALTGAATLTPAFSAPLISIGSPAASAGFTLTVSNGILSSLATTTVDVHPPIGAPGVDAGPAQVVQTGAAVTLNGVAADPNVPALPVTHGWAQTGGPSVTLTGADTLAPTFTAPVLTVGVPPAILKFALTATNGVASASAQTTVEVDPPVGPPSVDTGTPQSVAGGMNVTLMAAATDPNVPALVLTYQWTQTSGPAVAMTDTTARNVAFTSPVLAPGDSAVTLTFDVTVGNGVLSTVGSATVTVQPPAAFANSQQMFSEGSGTRTTTPFPVNAGDLIVAFVSAHGPSGSTQTATVSGGGLTWTLARRANSQRGTSEVWSAVAPASAAGLTVTATLSSSANTSLSVLTFAGAGGIGASAAASAASGAPAVSLTTTRAQSRVFAVGNDGTAAQARTPVAGQQLVRQWLGSADSHWLQTLTDGAVAAAGTAVQMRDSAPTADRWNFGAAEILTARPAVISSVRATTMATAAVVSWTTDVPTASRVDYGTSPGALTLSVTDPAIVTSHSVALYGLSPGAVYYYRVTSVDASWTASASPVPPAAPLSFTAVNPAGLVAAFSFSEGAGTTVTDLTGTGNTGVIGGATWTSGGRYGKALSFDGVSNWVTVNDSPSLDLTTNMTIEAWVNPATTSGWQSVLYKERPAATDAGNAWALYASDSSAPPAVYAAIDGASNSWTHATGTSMAALNTWTHLAGTFDGTSLRLYVNGTLVRTLSLRGRITATAGPLRIGGNAPSIPYGGQFFKGVIDEVRIYNRTLSQSEIQTDMNARLP